MRYTEKNLGDISFWRDSGSIENYANSLLRYCEKDVNLKILITNSLSTPRCISKGSSSFTIELPKPKDYYSDLLNQEKDILARKVFLKHELAHIIFSDFSLFNDHHSSPGTSFHFLWNALEDIRIESLFGKKFSGANDSFFEVQDMYFQKSKKGIENSKIDIQSLALYFIFRSKGSSFKSTKATSLYETLFLKYGNFIDLDASSLKDLIGKILLEFEGIKNEQEQANEQERAPQPPIESKQKNEQQESDLGEEQEQEQEQDFSEDIDNDENEEQNFDEQDNDDMNSSEPQDQGINESSEDNKAEEESEDETTDSSTSNSDTSSMINDLMNSVTQDEKDSFKDSINENEVQKEKESFEESTKAGIILNEGLPAVKDEEINFYKNLMSMLNNFCTFKEGELNSKESKIVPIRRYYKKVLSLNNREDSSSYNEIVKKNKKNIVGLTNYFKLKFQNKERSKLFNNREEGNINNNDLYKILIKNKNENTIFSKIENSIVNKSNIVFLLDFSSSMRGENVQAVIETMIVMNEVFSKLKIPYEMYSFSGTSEYKLQYSKKIKSVSNLFDSSVIIEADQRKLGKSYLRLKDNRYPLFQLRSIKDVEYATDKKMLGKLYNESRNGGPTLCNGSTPEVEAVLALRKSIHFSNKKLFILNDGEYNTVYNESKMSSEQKTLTDYESKYNSIPGKILYSFLNGKSFVLNSPSDIDIFKNISSSLKKITAYENILYNYFYGKRGISLKETDEVVSFINLLANELGDLNYNSLLKKDRIKIGSFGAINVNVSNKNISLTFVVNESSFSILKTKPERFETYHLKLTREDWDWISISTFISWACITRGDSYSSELMNDRVYSSLIEKMRNEGWAIYGLGIDSKRGKKYIGEKFFTVVDRQKIQETLLQNIREIV